MKKIILLSTLFLTAIVAQAQGPFLYEVETSWLAECDTSAPLTIEDFEGSTAGGGAFCGTILSSTSSNCFPIGELEDGFTITANNGASTFYGPPGQVGVNQDVPVVGVAGGQGQFTVVTFTQDVSRVSLNIFGISSSQGEGIIRVFDTDNILIETFNIDYTIGDFNFFGLQSETFIGKLELEDPDDGEGLIFGDLKFGTCRTNDDPNTAQSLIVGEDFNEFSIVSKNTFATDSTINNPSIPAPDCGSYVDSDIWFSIVVPDNGALTIETQQEPNSTLTDTAIAVYNSSLTTLIDCDDDSGEGTFSLLSYNNITPGDLLYVRVWEYEGNSYGSFKISAYSEEILSNNNEELTTQINYFPNPTKDFVTIKAKENISQIEIFNILGQKVISLKEKGTETIVDLSSEPLGMYMAVIKTDSGTQTIKIIKE